MKFPALLRRHIFWLNLPSTILITLLQRTPVLRLVCAAEEMVISSPLGSMLRSALVGSISLGGMATIAGATTPEPSTSSPAHVNAGSVVTVVFILNGTQQPVDTWLTSGSVPPGLSFSGDNSDILVLSGTATTAGTYTFSVIGTFQNFSSDPLSYTIIVAGGGVAPSITTQPAATQTVSVGANNVQFTVAASGTPTPTIQWKKGTNNVNGATSTTLTLNNVQLTDAGTYTAVATNASGSATSNNAVLVVNKLTQTINFGALSDIAYTTTPLNLSATATSSLAVSLSVVSGPATLSGNSLTITGVGSVTVRASQSGNANTYSAAPDVDRTFLVSQATATVTLGSLSPTYDGFPKSATATTNPASLTVGFTYDGSATPPTNAGSYAVVGTISSALYQGSASSTLVIAKATQSINFAPLADQPTTASPLTLSATATSSLPITFSVVSGPATVSGNSLTLTGTGLVTVRASQTGDSNYLAASDVDRTFNVFTAQDYEAWRQTHFTSLELADSNLSGPNAVYGTDGLTNLVKYALGLDPKVDTIAGLPVLSSDATQWIFTYTRPASITDLTYEVEISTNLSTWTTTGVTHAFVTSSGGSETWNAKYLLTAASTVYFRLKITHSAPQQI